MSLLATIMAFLAVGGLTIVEVVEGSVAAGSVVRGAHDIAVLLLRPLALSRKNDAEGIKEGET